MRAKLAGILIALAAIFIVGNLGFSQVQLGDKLGTEAQIDGFTAEKKNDFKRVMHGERDYKASDQALLELAAQYYIYRITWFDKIQRDRELLNKVREEFKAETDSAAKYKEPAAKAFANALLTCFGDVFKTAFDKNRMSHINAALMLPGLAQFKSEEVGDFLAKLIANPKTHDAVRMHAARALGEYFFAVPPMEQTVAKTDDLRKKKDPARIQALLDVIDKKWDPKKIDPAAVQYVRRDAIKALAQARIPAVEVGKSKLTAPAAIGLLKVLAVPPVLDPPPSLGEKLEAAIGICQLKIHAAHDLYVPEIGIHRTARALNELVKAYQTDFQNQFGGAGKKLKIPVMPWKYEAERVKQALKTLVENTFAKEDALKRARTLDTNMQPFLKALANHQAIEDLNNLNELVNVLRVDSPSVFKTIDNAPIGD
ncbi:MAG: HEAT repeat domain-containing protein [Planctomycetes bacterium]|nr:HEAT repeat domain-containing protein [Planctomycetota bacterium]